MTLFLDVTRTAGRCGRSTPVGIDRVEYAYAREIFLESDPADVYGILTTPWLSGAVAGKRVGEILRGVEAAWGLESPPSADPVYTQLKAWLATPLDAQAPHPKRFAGAQASRLKIADVARLPFGDLARSRSRLRAAAGAAGPSGAYLHVSHLLLGKPEAFSWAMKAGVKRAFMVHDAIPNEFPEFCKPGRDVAHLARLRNVASLASMILTISKASADAIAAISRENGWRAPPIVVNPLGVDPWFLDRARLDPPKPDIPYFLCVGTIEPRKNLAFLLLAWRRLAETLGERTPRLVLVGRRGWENENIVDMLERSRRLGPYVAEVADLTDAGHQRGEAGARALLAPSLAEGFGLPVVEALALRTPVVACDIPAHREAGGVYADYIDGVDGAGWMRAVEGLASGGSPIAPPGFVAKTWGAHVRESLAALAGGAG